MYHLIYRLQNLAPHNRNFQLSHPSEGRVHVLEQLGGSSSGHKQPFWVHATLGLSFLENLCWLAEGDKHLFTTYLVLSRSNLSFHFPLQLLTQFCTTCMGTLEASWATVRNMMFLITVHKVTASWKSKEIWELLASQSCLSLAEVETLMLDMMSGSFQATKDNQSYYKGQQS